MIRWFLNLLYGSISAEWESAYGIEESVTRLRAATKKSVFSALAEPAAVGTVSESKVKLQRVVPMVRNSFKPFLIGQFVERGERVFLVGRFTMLGAVKVFMSVWLGLVVVFGLAALFGHTAIKSGSFPFVLVPFAMTGFGVGLLWFGKWLARNDAGWLGDVVKGAIGGTAGEPDPPSAVPTATSATVFADKPAVVMVTAGVLGLMSAINLLAAFSGAFRFIPAHLSDAYRYAAAAEGALLLALAVGVFMRLRVAWVAGFLMIASAWAYSVASVFHMDARMGPPSGMKIVFAAFGLLVTVCWGRWWYAQRVHFVPSTQEKV
ncbi:MAG TPA: hypothetical protein VGO37_18310 [Steroidobacteraceae bacterium]|jgi:hypothetical protein|nr:hypothetical protein [Steroidobacteraceae bacterium]